MKPFIFHQSVTAGKSTKVVTSIDGEYINLKIKQQHGHPIK